MLQCSMSTDGVSISYNNTVTSDETFFNTTLTAPTPVHEEKDDLGGLIYHYGGFALVACINIPGNILVISTFLRHDALRSPPNFFMVSLAFSDLLTAFVYPTYAVAHIKSDEIKRTLGDWSICQFVMVEILALEICSSYHLLSITVIRYIAIVKPFHYNTYMTTKTALIGIVSVWVFSQSICYGMYLHKPDDYDNDCRYEKLYGITHVTVWFFFVLLLPLLVMLVLYLRIAKIARKQARAIAAQDRSMNGEGSSMAKERKSTIMVAFLLVCFASGWTPMLIYYYISFTCKTCNITPYVRGTTRIMLFSNSAVNFFIYAFRLDVFREAVKKDLKKLCGK